MDRPPTGPGARRILHLDMDAFYASVEVRDDPSLAGRPVVVGGTPEGRGVVAAASYEARAFGVRSAMSAALARRLCPQAVFLPPRMEAYVAASRVVFAALREYTPLVEPLSIDEAFLDVTGSRTSAPGGLVGDAVAIARELGERIARVTGGLTCSIGVAPNKFLAKLASDLDKPRGLIVVPEDVEAFLAPLPVTKLWGVGPKTAARLERVGLTTIGRIQAVSPADLGKILGVELGRHLARLARGLDDRPVVVESSRRSFSQERTFATFLPAADRMGVEREVFDLARGVAGRLRAARQRGRVVTLKVRDETFATRTRRSTLAEATDLVEVIHATAMRLWQEKVDIGTRRVRLLGVGVEGLVASRERQLEFFGHDRRAGREAKAGGVARAEDEVTRRFGRGAITRGTLLGRPATRRDEGDDDDNDDDDAGEVRRGPEARRAPDVDAPRLRD